MDGNIREEIIEAVELFKNGNFMETIERMGRMHQIALTCHWQDELDDALKYYEGALEIYGIFEAAPKLDRFLGTLLNDYAALLRRIGRIDESLEKCERALEIRQALLKSSPFNEEYRNEAGMTLNNLGNLLAQLFRFDEAMDRYKAALEIREALAEADPENRQYKAYVETTQKNISKLSVAHR